MRLKDLLEYNRIVIQCHDNPDADAIASGYGVYTYLKANGKEVRLVYGGRNIIRKSNLVTMVKELEIPIEHVKNAELEEPADLLVTVDCQYGEGNVTLYPAEAVAVIDHHRVERKLPSLNRVESNLGACSTLVWSMLLEEDVDANMDETGSTEHPSMSAIKSLLEYRLMEYFDKRDDVEAVIFDLDGTLLDTLGDLTDAVNVAMGKYNLPLRSVDEVRRFVGNGLRNLMTQAVEEGEDYPKFEELFEFFRTYYKDNCNHKTAPYDGVLELMKELKGRGIKMAIVSNKIDASVKELNEKFFADYIDIAIGEREGIRRKPAPDSLEEVLRVLDVKKDHVLYVGDSDVDILTADNADVRCISVSWGFRDEAFLMERGAGIIIERPLELLEYL